MDGASPSLFAGVAQQSHPPYVGAGERPHVPMLRPPQYPGCGGNSDILSSPIRVNRRSRERYTSRCDSLKSGCRLLRHAEYRAIFSKVGVAGLSWEELEDTDISMSPSPVHCYGFHFKSEYIVAPV